MERKIREALILVFERLLDDFIREIHSRVKTITVGRSGPPPLIQLRAVGARPSAAVPRDSIRL